MRRLLLALSFALAGLTPVAADGPTSTVLSTDVAGDANAVNNQAQEGSVPEQNVQTAPASVDGADLLSVAVRTLYQQEKVRDDAGRVVRVRHVPTALRIEFRTTAPAKPTFGPGVIFRMSANVGTSGCQVQFELYVAGQAPGSSPIERGQVNRLRNCPGGDGLLIGFPYSFEGDTATVTFPFASTDGMLSSGTRLTAYTRPHTRVVNYAVAAAPTAPAIDQSPAIASFTIGQDVPADIDCLQDPSHVACSG